MLTYYLIIINILGIFIMKIDKQKAINKKNRISEKTIWTISLLGGVLGTTIGMHIFHHKTKHLKFRIGLPTILIFWLLLLIIFKIKYPQL